MRRLRDLAAIADLSAAFDRDRAHPRAGAPALPDLTRLRGRRPVGAAGDPDEHPDADLRVYAVWFDMFEGDERATVDLGLLPDSRVTHFWDEGRRAGAWYGAWTRPADPAWVEWDAFFVYPRGATWDGSAEQPRQWGRTVIGKREDLRAALLPLLHSRR